MTCCYPNSNRGFSGTFCCSVDEVLYFNACLISTLAEGEWSAARAGRITPDTERVRCWMGPRADLDAMGRRTVSCPAGNR
jgi:hypothetical protein